MLNNELLLKTNEIIKLNEIITNLQYANDNNITTNSQLNIKLNEFSNAQDELIAKRDSNEATIETLRKELDLVTCELNRKNSQDDDNINDFNNNSNNFLLQLEEQKKSYEEDRFNSDIKIKNLTREVEIMTRNLSNLTDIIDENNIIIKTLKANEILLIESNDNTKQINESLSVQIEEFENNMIPNILSERSNFEIELNEKVIELETLTSEMNSCQAMLDAQTQDNCTLSLELNNKIECIKSLEINIMDNSSKNQQLQELINNNNEIIDKKNNEIEILEKKLYNNDVEQAEINNSLNIEISKLKEENNDYKLQNKNIQEDLNNIQDNINNKSLENEKLLVKYNGLLILNSQFESEINHLKSINLVQYKSIESNAIEKSELEAMLGKLEASDHTIEAYVAQRHELVRVNNELDRLSKLLIDKDNKIDSFILINKRREGELAGMQISMVSFNEEIDNLRLENDDLISKNSILNKAKNELKNENDKILALHEIETNEKNSLLLSLQNELQHQSNHQIVNSTDQNNKFQENKSINDIILDITKSFPELHNAINNSNETISNIDDQFMKLKNIIQTVCSYHYKQIECIMNEKESEISKLNNQIIVSSPNSNVQTPSSKKNSSDGVNSSPIVKKEISKLHSEIAHERRRLSILQEQHSDLLGLLAQQEVELNVFRTALEKTAGFNAVIQTEEEAQKVAIEKYGCYTNFRNYDEHVNDSLDINNQQLLLNSVTSPISNALSSWRD